MEEKVKEKYPRAYAKKRDGSWYIMNGIYELGMGYSKDAAWADAYTMWCV